MGVAGQTACWRTPWSAGDRLGRPAPLRELASTDRFVVHAACWRLPRLGARRVERQLGSGALRSVVVAATGLQRRPAGGAQRGWRNDMECAAASGHARSLRRRLCASRASDRRRFADSLRARGVRHACAGRDGCLLRSRNGPRNDVSCARRNRVWRSSRRRRRCGAARHGGGRLRGSEHALSARRSRPLAHFGTHFRDANTGGGTNGKWERVGILASGCSRVGPNRRRVDRARDYRTADARHRCR